MKKYILLISTYITSLAYFLFQGGKISLMVFAILNLLLIYLAFGYWSGRQKVQGNRTFNQQTPAFASTGIHSGQSVTVDVHLQLSKWAYIPYIIIEETLLRHDGKRKNFEVMAVTGFRHEAKAQYQIPQLVRGEYTFASTRFKSFDLFGLTSYKRDIEMKQTFRVLPQLLSQKQWSLILQSQHGSYSSPFQNKHAKESSQQSGVREYVYGDRLSKIHWNATARTGHWKSKDFEREALQKSIVVLDCYRNLDSDEWEYDEQFEHMVSITASLIDYSFNMQSPIGLLCIDHEYWYCEPSNMMSHKSLMMHHLVTVHQGSNVEISQLLLDHQKVIKAASMIHLVTEHLSTNLLNSLLSLQRKGINSTIFLPAVVNSVDRAKQSMIAMFKLQGIQVHESYKEDVELERYEGSDVG